MIRRAREQEGEGERRVTCSRVRRETGGSTPKPSQVSSTTLFGWEETAGSLAFGMYCSGYAQRVFSVSEMSSKSISRFCGGGGGGGAGDGGGGGVVGEGGGATGGGGAAEVVVVPVVQEEEVERRRAVRVASPRHRR